MTDTTFDFNLIWQNLQERFIVQNPAVEEVKEQPELADQSNDQQSLSSEMSSSEEASWISWYCSLRGNDFFCHVEEEYIEDRFNLTGLIEKVPHFAEAMDMILDIEPSDDEDSRSHRTAVEKSAELLYGLIHQRFIVTTHGLHKMLQKYTSADFGHCPRIFCDNQAVLPVGLSDIPDEQTVKVFCPSCMDVFKPRSSRYKSIDGAFFGTSFPHLLFMAHPQYRPKTPPAQYVPRIYGFKLHPGAYEPQPNFKSAPLAEVPPESEEIESDEEQLPNNSFN